MCAAVPLTVRSVLHLPRHDREHRPQSSLTTLTCVTVMGGRGWVQCGSTALRSRTVGRCAGRGSPQSEPARGSESTAASASSRQGAPSSWAGLCALQGAEEREVINLLFCCLMNLRLS